ncbi:MAG: MFS transporter [Chitinophagaceae bacterium]|nr:MFS transporter [Chitinophagaceae bacterium]
MTWKERILLILLAALNFTHILDFMIMMPLGNYLMPYFSINTQQFTFLVSAYSGSAAVTGFAAAFFVDGFDRKRVLLFGYSGFLLGTIACGFAPSYPLLLLSRLVAGSFGGLIGAQVLSMVSDLFGYERRARAMGAVMSAFAMASTFGVPFALYLANHFSWHAPFILVGGLGILIIPLIVYFIPPMTSHLHSGPKENKWNVLTNVLKDKRQRNALLFSGMVILGHFSIIPFINPFMEFNNGFPRSVTPLIYLVGGISSFVAANLLGALADKYGKLKVFNFVLLLSIIPVYLITHQLLIPFYFVLGLFSFWFIMSTGRGVSSQALISNVVKPEHRGGFMSFNSSMQQLGTTLASLITGYIVVKHPDGKIYNYEWAGYLSIAVLVGCVFMANAIFKGFDKTTIVKKETVTPEA